MKRSILIGMAVLLLLGCQPTPTEEIVTRKDTGELLELALTVQPDEQSASYEAPPVLHVTKDCDVGNADVTVSIDADVVLPDTSRIPMVHIQKGAFSEDFLRRVAHVLGNDSRPIEVYPKSYYMEIANGLIAQRDSGNLGKYDSVEDINRAILRVLNQADAAPDEPVFSDRDPVTEHDSLSPEPGSVLPDDGWWITTYGGMSSIGTVFWMLFEQRCVSYFRDIHGITAFENAYNYRNPLNTAQPMIDKGRIRVTLPTRTIEDAEAEALRVMDELGLSDDFALCHAQIAPLMEYAEEAQKNGCEAVYEFLFTRVVSGVAITYTNDRSGNGSYKDAPEGAVAPEWRYERVRVYIDDLGVLAFYYDGMPYEITEITSPSVKILSLDEAVARFERMVAIRYASQLNRDTETDKQIHVTEIRLGLTRVLEQNAAAKAYLVPSWTFFGTLRLEDNPYVPGWEGEGFDGTTAILTVNAIDGSIIDRNAGY